MAQCDIALVIRNVFFQGQANHGFISTHINQASGMKSELFSRLFALFVSF
jgi:hypothetical protein